VQALAGTLGVAKVPTLVGWQDYDHVVARGVASGLLAGGGLVYKLVQKVKVER